MSATNLESFLARLYTDERLRSAFLENPDEAMSAHELDASEVAALRNIDRAGLAFAARSYAHKRAAHATSRPRGSWLSGLVSRVRRFGD